MRIYANSASKPGSGTEIFQHPSIQNFANIKIESQQYDYISFYLDGKVLEDSYGTYMKKKNFNDWWPFDGDLDPYFNEEVDPQHWFLAKVGKSGFCVPPAMRCAVYAYVWYMAI